MKKVGVFLDMFPAGGGAFQYGQFVLEAISDTSTLKPYALYTRKEWGPILQSLGIESKYVTYNNFQNLIRRIFHKLKIPITIWQFVSKFIWPYSKEMHNANCDVWIFPSQDCWGYEAGVNSIATIHDLMHRYEKFPELIENGQKEARDNLYSNICKYSTKILVDSNLGKQQVLDCYKVDPEKIEVQRFSVPNYIFDYEKVNVQNKYNLPDKYLLYPAQFWSHKNHLNLIKGIKEIRSRIPEICLVFTGAKEKEYDLYWNYVKENKLENNILFIGYAPDRDMACLYKNSNGLVMGSCCGPTNIPPLESLFLETPVAVSDVYAAREQLGDSVLYFDPRNITEISNAMKRLWLEEDLPNNYDFIKKSYSKEKFKESLIKVVSKCLM